MGKKHSKFKKHGGVKHRPVQHQVVHEVTMGNTAASTPPKGAPSGPELEESLSSILTTSQESKQLDETAVLDEKYAFVRRDVRKLMIVLGSLVVLFIAIYFLNIKTEILVNLGNWVYRVTHISI